MPMHLYIMATFPWTHASSDLSDSVHFYVGPNVGQLQLVACLDSSQNWPEIMFYVFHVFQDRRTRSTPMGPVCKVCRGKGSVAFSACSRSQLKYKRHY